MVRSPNRPSPDCRAGAECSQPQSRHIARRIQSDAGFVDHTAEVNVGPDLRSQLATRHDLQFMMKLAPDDLHLPGIVVEMRLLAGNFKMSAAGEVAFQTAVEAFGLAGVSESAVVVGVFATVQEWLPSLAVEATISA